MLLLRRCLIACLFVAPRVRFLFWSGDQVASMCFLLGRCRRNPAVLSKREEEGRIGEIRPTVLFPSIQACSARQNRTTEHKSQSYFSACVDPSACSVCRAYRSAARMPAELLNTDRQTEPGSLCQQIHINGQADTLSQQNRCFVHSR